MPSVSSTCPPRVDVLLSLERKGPDRTAMSSLHVRRGEFFVGPTGLVGFPCSRKLNQQARSQRHRQRLNVRFSASASTGEG